jgi:hypothetical protein
MGESRANFRRCIKRKEANKVLEAELIKVFPEIMQKIQFEVVSKQSEKNNLVLIHLKLDGLLNEAIVGWKCVNV